MTNSSRSTTTSIDVTTTRRVTAGDTSDDETAEASMPATATTEDTGDATIATTTASSSTSAAAATPSEPDSSSSKMKLIGGHQNGMYLILPDPEGSDEDREVLDMIKTVKARLQEKAYVDKIKKWIRNSSVLRSAEDAGSAREIQGNRIEMFLQATGKSSAAFDEVLAPKLADARRGKDRILAYAKRQALKDPRMREVGSNDDDWEFDNFSLIFTYGKVEKQAPHLDLIKPLFQFGLMVSDKSPSTLLHDPLQDQNGTASTGNQFGSIDELKRHWVEMVNEEAHESDSGGVAVDRDIPQTILDVLDREETDPNSVVNVLLHDYGIVLRSWKFASFYKNQMKQEEEVRTGSVMSMPGGVVHAGASSQKMRCVIFFSAKPKSSDAKQYDPDVQWMTTTLAFRLISLLWYRPGIGYKERVFFLRRLAQYAEHCTVKNTATLCPGGQLADFLAAIEKKSYAKKMTKEQFIEETADSKDLVTPNLDLREYTECAKKNLYTEYEGKEERVVVHHRLRDHKVVLGYPQRDMDGDGFEGHQTGDNYRVVMKPAHENEVFDGTNALYFLDNDGEKFDVYLKDSDDGVQKCPSSYQTTDRDIKRSHQVQSHTHDGQKLKQPRLDEGPTYSAAVLSG